MPRSNSGWAKSYKLLRDGLQWPAPQPPEFERVVAQMGLTEAQAADDPRAQRWIRNNYTRHFVPEQILMYLGITVSDRDIGCIDWNAPRSFAMVNRGATSGRQGITQRDS